MYNLNYAPATLGVQSWRENISGGTRRNKKLECHRFRVRNLCWLRILRILKTCCVKTKMQILLMSVQVARIVTTCSKDLKYTTVSFICVILRWCIYYFDFNPSVTAVSWYVLLSLELYRMVSFVNFETCCTNRDFLSQTQIPYNNVLRTLSET
jgi:hypothetical protein